MALQAWLLLKSAVILIFINFTTVLYQKIVQARHKQGRQADQTIKFTQDFTDLVNWLSQFSRVVMYTYFSRAQATSQYNCLRARTKFLAANYEHISVSNNIMLYFARKLRKNSQIL